ncbi:Golgi-associated plant pathogenesis-related protein 1-like [Glandiceps talaboti]
MGCGGTKVAPKTTNTGTTSTEKPADDNTTQPPNARGPESTNEDSFLKNLWEETLKSHNLYRDIHDSKPLTLDNKLSEFAQEWADHIANTDEFEHRPDNEYGENLYFYMHSGGKSQLTGEKVTTSFYDEISDYNFNDPGFSMETGHFTQVVWNNSSQLGVGFAESKQKANHFYVVCNYHPAGNVEGQFGDNVGPPRLRNAGLL